ncbi:putative GPI-anchored adhesin-like protein PGA55 [Apostichopus japonicus]|uniref:Putative GPI-anchored adhesin-like protein PGA55 n=1 Tax=Stichopus japonicus TaxID=307972 RepID=A0A2G8KZJ7_STIJA|nr:putative GPI-anchored adhesin-like protein PGA55 [Apostichopus japonicus]
MHPLHATEKSSSDHNLQHFTSAESYHHSRPLPAPRLNTPHLPIKDHKATPPDQKEEILSPSPKKRDLDSPRQTGYETVTYKPPCLQLYNEGFFPKHVGSSFEEDETTGSNEEYQSSCDEEATTRKREIEFLSLALKQDLSLSKEKRIKCEPPPKRNSDGSVRSVPEGWGGSEYAVFKQPEKEEHRSFHHKHIRSHSSGGQLVLFNSNITVLHTGEKINQKGDKGEIRSADMFPIAQTDTFKPTQNSPPHHHHGREPKRVPRTTHEHVTLGQHVHSSLHSSPLGGSPKEKELKYKYLDDVPSIQRSPQAGSPSRQGQTPDVPCLQRSPQAGSLSTQGQNPDVPCLQRSPQAGSPSTQGQTPWWDDNGEEDQLEEKPIPSYINQPWYYGKLLRQECDYLMISKGNPCQYLVRDSSHRAGGLMLCVLYGQKVHHYIIHVINDTEYQMAGHTFASVSEIIEFYRKHVIMYSPNQEPVFLGEPFLYPR